ncbi:MAG: N-acetyl sugar amidotransferase [Bacillota bacterium]
MRRIHEQPRPYQVCTNCVMDTSDSQIQFDDKGVCDHCRNYYENIRPNWHPDETGARELERIADEIRCYGKGRRHDCLIGLSGGLDSSYVTYLAKERLGLRPLVFTVNTGWNLEVADRNIDRIVRGLGVDVHEETVDWEEMKDLQKAFLKSQVPYQDTPQDHAIFAALYNYAAANEFRYVLTGGNYSTECVREPNEWVHANDLRLLKDIHRRFGTRPLKIFPMCSIFRYRVYYRYVKGMRIIQPLNMIPYRKELAIKELSERFGWEPYGNKHFENLFTRFYEGYWLPKKFGYDKRRAHFSSLVLTGQMTRDEALGILAQPPYDERTAMDDLRQIASRLDMTEDELVALMNGENRTYRDYKSSLGFINLAVGLARLLGLERRNLR